MPMSRTTLNPSAEAWEEIPGYVNMCIVFFTYFVWEKVYTDKWQGICTNNVTSQQRRFLPSKRASSFHQRHERHERFHLVVHDMPSNSSRYSS